MELNDKNNSNINEISLQHSNSIDVMEVIYNKINCTFDILICNGYLGISKHNGYDVLLKNQYQILNHIINHQQKTVQL